MMSLYSQYYVSTAFCWVGRRLPSPALLAGTLVLDIDDAFVPPFTGRCRRWPGRSVWCLRPQFCLLLLRLFPHGIGCSRRCVWTGVSLLGPVWTWRDVRRHPNCAALFWHGPVRTRYVAVTVATINGAFTRQLTQHTARLPCRSSGDATLVTERNPTAPRRGCTRLPRRCYACVVTGWRCSPFDCVANARPVVPI